MEEIIYIAIGIYLGAILWGVYSLGRIVNHVRRIEVYLREIHEDIKKGAKR